MANNIFSPNKPGSEGFFNSDRFMERMDHDPKMFNSMLNIFKNGYPGHRQKLQQFIIEQASEELRKEAHSIWGELGILGHEPAIEAASALEDLGRSGKLDGAQEWFDKLDQAVQPILKCENKGEKV